MPYLVLRNSVSQLFSNYKDAIKAGSKEVPPLHGYCLAFEAEKAAVSLNQEDDGYFYFSVAIDHTTERLNSV